MLAYLWLSAVTVFRLCGGLRGVFILVFLAAGSFFYVLGFESNIIIVGVIKLFYAGLVLYYRGCSLIVLVALFSWIGYAVLETSVVLSAIFYGLGFKYVFVVLVAYTLAYVFWGGGWATLTLVIGIPGTYVFLFKSYLLLWGFLLVSLVAIWVTSAAVVIGEVQGSEYRSGFIFAGILI